MEQEKIFVKLWNHFMKTHIAIADSFIPQACFQFLESYFHALAQHNLRQELMLHFSGLWDHGLISSTHFLNLMATFDKMADEQQQTIERISLDG
jgi:VEFS-Box of polycomb protein